MNNIAENLKIIHEELEIAAEVHGHKCPTLVAVSKGHSAKRVEEALIAGHKCFGENRVQEAAEKWPGLREKYKGLELHLIGPLQTNKVKPALSLFDCIQTLDRPKLADTLAREIKNGARAPALFIQVNTGEEPQKSGVFPKDLPEFYAYCKDLGLKIEGLMCIPPQDDEPAMHFGLLKKLGAEAGLEKFSMGMSGDYKIAAGLGATHVRVGTAIFGPRGGDF